MGEKDETMTEKEAPARRLMKKETLIKIAVMVGIVGIGLIFFSSMTGRKNVQQETDKAAAEQAQLMSVEEYREGLCAELGAMVASIEGAGRTKLMVTIDGTVRNIFASDEDISARQSMKSDDKDEQNSEKRSCIVIRRSDGSEEALTVGQLMPKVRGVLVVCDGGGDEAVIERIKQAVAAAVNISESRICVSKMGQ